MDTQAVYKHGEENWALIARDLRHHAMLNRQSDFFNQKASLNCSLQYYLLIEELESEKRQTKILATPEMPSVVKLARKFYTQRIDELKNAIKEDEEKFMNIVSEIDDIRSGRWDKSLTETLKSRGIVDNSVTNTPVTGETSTSAVLPNISESMKSQEQETNTAIDLMASSSAATDKSMKEDVTKEVEQQNIPPLLATDNDEIRTPSGDDSIALPIQLQATSEDMSEIESSSARIDSSMKHPTSKKIVSDIITKTTSDSDESQTLLHLPTENESTSPLETGNGFTAHRVVGEESQTAGSKRKLDEVEDAQIEEMEAIPSKFRRFEPDEYKQEQEQTAPVPAAAATGTPQHVPSPGLVREEKVIDEENAESVTESESNVTSPTAATTPSSLDRKRGKDEQRQKSWQKNINLLWREIANHKNGAMFMNPIKEATAPRYYDIVKHPMDLKTIKNRIKDGVIKTTVEFERDVMLMLTNSLMYNKEGTEIYQMAQEMWEDTMEQMKIFKTADGNTSTSAHTRKSSSVAKERAKNAAEQ
ncbi:hypothetical protein EC973_000449 [Apophysomyces ossiformis]|uniref:Bromo domain-containing protein n=1 Tax=Apophysomyces ossiformis TaxID=679940 RepID=A0A8H7BL46_9FUNG|nr:hypothetical protein EC973_000449 [Apophysomyces ossiformis]